MSGGQEFSLPSGEGGVVDEKLHVNRRRIDGDEGEGGAVRFVGNGGADFRGSQSGQSDNVAGRGAFDLDSFHSTMREKFGDAAGFRFAFGAEAGHGIAHLDGAGDDTPDGDTSHKV